MGDPKARQGKSNAFLLAGVVGILGGLALLAYGFAPAKDLWEAVGPTFSGGPPPEDLSERLDASMAELKARAIVDGLGFLALLAGFVLCKAAFAKPKPKSVEQLVQEEVARRMAAQSAPVAMTSQSSLPLEARTSTAVASSSLTAPAATPPPFSSPPPFASPPAPVAPPAPAPARQGMAPRRSHCATCGSVLVAGGRICPQGHAQA